MNKLPRLHPQRERHAERNAAIRSMREAGLTYEKVAAEYGLSGARCHQIVEGRRQPHRRRHPSRTGPLRG
jgi:Mor family transcriptional regulator